MVPALPLSSALLFTAVVTEFIAIISCYLAKNAPNEQFYPLKYIENVDHCRHFARQMSFKYRTDYINCMICGFKLNLVFTIKHILKVCKGNRE